MRVLGRGALTWEDLVEPVLRGRQATSDDDWGRLFRDYREKTKF